MQAQKERRIPHLRHLVEMISDEATFDDGEALRDILVDFDLLDWEGDDRGGYIAEIDDRLWSTLVGKALSMSEDEDDDSCDMCGSAFATAFEQGGSWHTLCDDCEERTRPEEVAR